MRQTLFKAIAFLFWVSLIALFWWYIRTNNITIVEAIQRLIDIASMSAVGPLTFVLFYIFQPILFFPSSLLTIAAGYLYGPLYGSVLAVLGSNGSAVLAYLIGRYFGLSVFDPTQANGRLKRYIGRLNRNSFTAVLIMRLVYLPYDPVSYLSGFLRIPLWPFVMGTFLGGVVGSISFALFGASIEGDFSGQTPGIDPVTLTIAIILSLISIIVSRYIRQREEALVEPESSREGHDL